MQLNEIGFAGYKAFAGAEGDQAKLQQLSIAPLTVIFGKNNSGKSAVVRLPRLLLGGLAADDERLLPLDVRNLKYGGRFVDIVHGGAFFRRPTFQLRATHDNQSLDLTATLYSPGALSADDPPRIWSYRLVAPEQLEIAPPTSPTARRPKFRGLLPHGSTWDHWRNAAAALLNDMVHLGPMRAPIQPSYVEEQPKPLSLDGKEAPQWLRIDVELSEALEAWFEVHMEGWRLWVARGNDSFSLRIGKSRTLATNLAYAGEGFQQVLPVVVHQLLRQRQAPANFLDVIEHPDLHLHAAAHAPLADLFIQTVRRTNGRLLIETHSEPMLLRIQRRVADRSLSKDSVALYFVDDSQDSSTLRRIHLTSDGEVDWWPEGVFEEDFDEVAAIRREQRLHGGGDHRP